MAKAKQMTSYCSCGKRLVGNGAKASHRRAHEKRNEMKHQGGVIHAMTRDQFEGAFGAAAACGMASDRPPEPTRLHQYAANAGRVRVRRSDDQG